MRGQRVVVQARTMGCSLMETFTHGRRQAGDTHLAVVNSVEEAHAMPSLGAPHFEDVR